MKAASYSTPSPAAPMRRRAWLGQAALAVCVLSSGALTAACAQTPARPAVAPKPANTALDEEVFTAVRRDNAARLERLIADNISVNIIGPDRQTPMTLALQLGSMKAFDALMASPKTNVEFRNGNDETPLMIAAIRGNLNAVQRLIRQGASVNKTGWAPLHYAASGESDEQVAITRLLLDYKADVNSLSPNKTTPLMMAASYGSDQVVQLLINAGADVTRKNELGMTAVDFAKRAGRDTLARQLTR